MQEGCDKFCAFCVVPYTRGAEVSRPVARLLDEARGLVAQGVREITLLGQNVNAYHGAGQDGAWGLSRLLRELAMIPGLERLRYTTSHPNDMEDDLIAAHGDLPQLMPYLHLPVQSGSDRILKAMNRKHTAEAYLRLVERIRAARPDILLSSDFIVGFPGETEADFQATLDLIRTVGFGQAFSFKYSARPGTPAAEKAPVPAEVADARLHALQALITAQQRAGARGDGRARGRGAVRKARASAGADGRQVRSPACRACGRPGGTNRRTGPGARVSFVFQLFGGRTDFLQSVDTFKLLPNGKQTGLWRPIRRKKCFCPMISFSLA